MTKCVSDSELQRERIATSLADSYNLRPTQRGLDGLGGPSYDDFAGPRSRTTNHEQPLARQSCQHGAGTALDRLRTIEHRSRGHADRKPRDRRCARRLDEEFCRAADCLYHCRGSAIVTGIGKAGLIGQKIMATLASTGTRSHFLHPAEAVHGDLGRIHGDDVVLVLSQSGETEEIVRLLPPLAEAAVPIIAITGKATSTLARAARAVIDLGPTGRGLPAGAGASSSTAAMLAVGDALALVVSRMRGFARDDFARYHPAGNLGLQLSKVQQHMRPLEHCRVARQEETVRQVLVRVSVPGRRSGATMLIDAAGRLDRHIHRQRSCPALRASSRRGAWTRRSIR